MIYKHKTKEQRINESGDRKLLLGGFSIASPLEIVKKFSRTFSFQFLSKDGAEMSFHVSLGGE